MRHSDLVVLGLLGAGPRHGYEITRRIENARIRSWAKISRATVYRALDRQEERGHLASETEREGDRPERTVYRLTPSGRERLRELVREALASEEPVYSDRLVGAAFARVALAEEEREETLPTALEDVRAREDRLRETARDAVSPLGKAILEFQAAVGRAERELLETIRTL